MYHDDLNWRAGVGPALLDYAIRHFSSNFVFLELPIYSRRCLVEINFFFSMQLGGRRNCYLVRFWKEQSREILCYFCLNSSLKLYFLCGPSLYSYLNYFVLFFLKVVNFSFALLWKCLLICPNFIESRYCSLAFGWKGFWSCLYYPERVSYRC